MKKFYCNGKIVYMHNSHNSLSAKCVLNDIGISNEYNNVCQALDQDQDMLDVEGPNFDEAAVELDSGWKALDTDFDLPEDCYTLPNGKSAPYGLSGYEIAAMKDTDMVYVVSLLQACGFVPFSKGQITTDSLLLAVDRDLIFATREKAVEAYNALFGDIYGEI